MVHSAVANTTVTSESSAGITSTASYQINSSELPTATQQATDIGANMSTETIFTNIVSSTMIGQTVSDMTSSVTQQSNDTSTEGTAGSYDTSTEGNAGPNDISTELNAGSNDTSTEGNAGSNDTGTEGNTRNSTKQGEQYESHFVQQQVMLNASNHLINYLHLMYYSS